MSGSSNNIDCFLNFSQKKKKLDIYETKVERIRRREYDFLNKYASVIT